MKDYAAGIHRMDTLMAQGVSFSGSEPNCAFLNLGNGTFATVAGIAGFDFPDDSRSLATTDWDGDGAVDVWVTNRSAPGIRFLRNAGPATAQPALQLRLRGVKANRLGIGARVEVEWADKLKPPLTATVKAGEGYLGQSTSTLHFGLGREGNDKSSGNPIAAVQVHWPGGATEIFRGISPGIFELTEGTGQAKSITMAPKLAASAAQPIPSSPANSAGRVRLPISWPMPGIPSLTPDGKSPTLASSAGKPILLSLYDPQCTKCQSGAAEWQRNSAQFAAAGLEIQFLRPMIDPKASNPANHPGFSTLQLTDVGRDMLQEIQRLNFTWDTALPTPFSLLLDSKGHLAAIYRGETPSAAILEDLRWLKLPADQRLAQSFPFPGKFLQPPRLPDPVTWLTFLVPRGQWAAAAQYFHSTLDTLRLHREFASIAAGLAAKLQEAGEKTTALAVLTAAKPHIKPEFQTDFNRRIQELQPAGNPTGK